MRLKLWIAALLSVSVSAQAARWKIPAPAESGFYLPRLAQPLTLDGSINEWSSAFRLRMISPAHIQYTNAGHKWLGPSDAGAEFYCAWNDEGACVAAFVADDDVRNDKSVPDFWKQDCFEIFIDGRASEKLHTEPYTAGAYQILVKPALGSAAPVAALNPRDGEIKGLKVAGKTTSAGYSIEVFIPWSAFPGLTAAPGSEIGLSFALDDYDSRDGGVDQPITMNYGAKENLYRLPQNLMNWTLVDQLDSDPATALRRHVSVETGTILFGDRPLGVCALLDDAISDRVASVRIGLIDPGNEIVFSGAAELVSQPAHWQKYKTARIVCPAGVAKRDGTYRLDVKLLDHDAKLIGIWSRGLVSPGSVVKRLLDRIGDVDVAGLSQSDPFRAAAYLSAGASLERAKALLEILAARGAQMAKTELEAAMFRTPEDVLLKDGALALDETEARLDVLENGRVSMPEPGLLDLLDLGANPQAQVAVEYRSPDYADVTLYWGPLPLASASVRQYETAEAAAKNVEPVNDAWVIADASQTALVAGLPCKIPLPRTRLSPFDLEHLDPSRQVVLLSLPDSAFALSCDDLGIARADAAVILPGCPADVGSAVREWASEQGVELTDPDSALERKRVLVAGPIDPQQAPEKLKSCRLWSMSVSSAFYALTAVNGKRLIRIWHPVRQVAERLVALIAAGKPITPESVDEVRRMIVEALAPKGAAPRLPDGCRLFAGDVHMHTFYSDGLASPVGLGLQSIACFHDFTVITDHETLKGAQLAQKQFLKHGFGQTFIVGQEITEAEFHANAYPLREKISNKLPLYEVTRAAHRQGAVVQWNHPWDSGEWSHKQLQKGLAGTAFDAWEHVPYAYDEWKAAGECPLIVGSTDTHSGTFGESERTFIVAPSTRGIDVAESIRCGRAAAAACYDQHFLYGPDDATAAVWSALAEGTRLRSATEEHLKKVLRNADLRGVLQESSPRAIDPDNWD